MNTMSGMHAMHEREPGRHNITALECSSLGVPVLAPGPWALGLTPWRYSRSALLCTNLWNHPMWYLITPWPPSPILQDLEITRGYVPGFDHVLGHEFVGVVESCTSQPELVGRRVVGEINCNICGYTCADAVFQRNHAPGRWVQLGPWAHVFPCVLLVGRSYAFAILHGCTCGWNAARNMFITAYSWPVIGLHRTMHAHQGPAIQPCTHLACRLMPAARCPQDCPGHHWQGRRHGPIPHPTCQ